MCGLFIIVKAYFVFYITVRDLWPGGFLEGVVADSPSM